MRRWTIGFWVTLLGTLLLTYALSEARTRNTHGLSSSGEEQASWWGGAGQAHVVSGCIHGLSATTSATIASCQAFTQEEGPPEQLRYVWEDEVRTITYNAGDGTYWLIVYAGNVTDAVPGGWTRAGNTSYLWQLNAVYPTTIPNNALLVMASTVAGGAITVVNTTLHANNPFIFDRAEYATTYGFKCDGLASSAAGNDAALVAAHDALPISGGRLVLPASQFKCLLSVPFLPTKTLWIQGAGGGKANAGLWRRTWLEYTGSDVMIAVENKPTVGLRLEGFEINHTGTATHAIRTSLTSNIHMDDVTSNIPTVPFSVAAIAIGDTDITHSVTLDRVHIRQAGPRGLLIVRTNGVWVTNSTFRFHSMCNVSIGEGVSGNAKDTHLISTTLENDQVGATAVCIFDAEHVVIDRSHFEQSGGSFAAIATFATSTQAEHIVVTKNFFKVLSADISPSSENVISFDRPGTYAVIAMNSLNLCIGCTLGSGALVSVPNDNGAAYLTIRDNLLFDNSVGNPIVKEIDFPYNVVAPPQLSGNHGLLAGRIPLTLGVINPWCIVGDAAIPSATTGETILASCTIPGGTFDRADQQGWRLTANGTLASNANNKQVQVRLGSLTGPVLWNTGTLTLNNGSWHVTCLFVPTNATTSLGGCHGGAAQTSLVAGTSMTKAGLPVLPLAAPNETWSTDQVVVITGIAATANGDVQLLAATLEILK